MSTDHEWAGLAGLMAITGTDTDVLPGHLRRLDEAALLAMARALGREGLFRPGVAHRWDQIADRLGVAPRHRWILRRWLAVLAEEGMLHRDAATGNVRDLRTVRRAEVAATAPAVHAACRGLGYPGAIADFFLTAADQLPRLLRDEVTVQSLLFRDDDTSAAEGAYRDNTINRYLNAAAAELLRRTPAPAARPVRVLELGAGIGGTTTTLLAALADRPVDYLFTDVSRYFLDAARQRFGDRLRYALLDINAELAEPRVPPGAADVVVAANVLHNALHIGAALTRVRRLLAPGGLLLVIESCREHYQAMTSMQFLMSPPDGAPRPGTSDIRAGTDRIFLTAEEWRAVLAEDGYRPLFDLPDPDHPLTALGQRLFVARAPGARPSSTTLA
ncbi:class I SAM-dependent methyltransferase [Streptomyces sp. MS19]|uniref:class I SAM-dependent methyltransferase n=1 Tax=Streptomyces sp. MS19 TaxID=3385972 RepID=UPI00399EEE03